MRATTTVIAITAVVAVAAIAVTMSRFSVDGGPTQLGPVGIVVTPAVVGTATPATPGIGAPTSGAGAVSGTSAPTGRVVSRAPVASGQPTSTAHPVAPAPARTLPSQAATGKPGTPGRSGDHGTR